MWYLIVPPIVFISSLALLFWFLSKKRADPAIQERMADEGTKPASRRFLFIKEETGLRILEKIAKRLNLVSLKFHNRFNQFSSFLRERRRKVTEPEVRPLDENRLRREGREHFWGRFQRRDGNNVATPVESPESQVSSSETAPQAVGAAPNATPEPAQPERSFVREAGKSFGDSLMAKSGEAARVFRRRRMPAGNGKRLSEEELIDRIARNPKDAAAYEELGDFYMESGNLSDAKACYRQVIKLSPLNREVKEKVRRLERLLVQKEKTRG